MLPSFLRRFVLAAVLGATTMVAVAWVLVARGPGGTPGPIIHRGPHGGLWMGSDVAGRGWRRFVLWPAGHLTEHGIAVAEPLPTWTNPPPERERDLVVEMVAAGWPRACLRARRTGRDDTEAHTRRTGVMTTGLGPSAIVWNEWSGGLARGEGRTSGPGSTEAEVLPWRPIWRGAAFDLALFGGMWLVLLNVAPAFRVARRLRRRWRGRCVRCGYDLRGASASCPECGLAAGNASS